MKGIRLFVATVFILIGSLFFINETYALVANTASVFVKGTPAPVNVKVSVANVNWVEIISICNTSTTAIPLTNIEFNFNYAMPMPTNIWGDPWVAWTKSSQQGSAVVLKGGTPYTPALQPDPACSKPLTIQFNAAPTDPAPTGPFVFKSDGGQVAQAGNLTINLGSAPAQNLPAPTVTVTGSGFSQKQTLNWNGAWQLTNLTPGSYSITATLVDNGTNYYAAPAITATVVDKQTTTQQISYVPVVTGNVSVTLVKAPTTQVPLTLTGSTYTFNKNVSAGTTLILPKDSYTVSSTIAGYTAAVTPNPVVVPSTTSFTVTYTSQSQTSAGPFTTSGGQILDKNKNPVSFRGINWFGFNTDIHIVHGLWTADFTTMLNQIKSLGFNAIRIPFQFDFILNTNIKPSSISTYCSGKPCNANVPQDSALNAFQWVVKQFTDNGIYVLLDDHYEDNTYVSNNAQWIAGWQKVAQLFINNPMVGYDLYNEPDSHSLAWDTSNSGKAWATGITSAASAIYAIDPTKLIFIEGTGQNNLESNWGDGFATDNAALSVSNPKQFFTQLASQPYINQIVISPHVYGPDGTSNAGPDHSNQTTAFAAWARLHGYLLNNFLNVNNTAQSGFCIAGACHVYPIAIGEFGGKFDPADPDYAKDVATNINLANFLKQLGKGKPAQPSWFYWDWNPNSANTGGILASDWKTIDCNKVNYLRNNLGLQTAAGICPAMKK